MGGLSVQGGFGGESRLNCSRKYHYLKRRCHALWFSDIRKYRFMQCEKITVWNMDSTGGCVEKNGSSFLNANPSEVDFADCDIFTECG